MRPDINYSPIVIDLETSAHPQARDFIDPPTFEDISAPSNYKDEVKIAAYIADAKAKRQAEYEAAIGRNAALDYNVGRIVALGYWTAQTGTDVLLCRDEAEEAAALAEFWAASSHRTIVGFGVKTFDLRYIVRRSQLLGVSWRDLDFGKYTRKGVTDLYLDLTFNDGHYDKGCMRRSLNAFARRFGVPVPDQIDGAEIPALVEAGRWDDVAAHCREDIALTLALARKLRVVWPEPEPEGADPDGEDFRGGEAAAFQAEQQIAAMELK